MLKRHILVLLSIMLLAATGLIAQARAKRLILKDGSYQSVREWQVKGDRVRYYSTERFDWEELPNSLVDWAATDKFNSSTNAATPDTVAAEEEDATDRAAAEAAQPLVAPGLRMPASEGVFMLDQSQGQPSLVELNQSGADLNKQKGRNILHAAINP